MSKKSHGPRAKPTIPDFTTPPSQGGDRWIAIKELSGILGLSQSKCRYLGNPESKYFDPTFPPRIQDKGGRSVRFSFHAVAAWMAAQANSEQASEVEAANASDTLDRAMDAMVAAAPGAAGHSHLTDSAEVLAQAISHMAVAIRMLNSVVNQHATAR